MKIIQTFEKISIQYNFIRKYIFLSIFQAVVLREHINFRNKYDANISEHSDFYTKKYDIRLF